MFFFIPVTGKIIYTDYQVAVLYLCEDETIQGECLQYRVSILSRTQTLDSMGRSLLEAKLKLPCEDLSANLTQITGNYEYKYHIDKLLFL